jgi:hypothetical protein
VSCRKIGTPPASAVWRFSFRLGEIAYLLKLPPLPDTSDFRDRVKTLTKKSSENFCSVVWSFNFYLNVRPAQAETEAPDD